MKYKIGKDGISKVFNGGKVTSVQIYNIFLLAHVWHYNSRKTILIVKILLFSGLKLASVTILLFITETSSNPVISYGSHMKPNSNIY